MSDFDEQEDMPSDAKTIRDLKAENASLRARADRAVTAALRYESRHDRDPERVKLWAELKMALMVDAALPSAGKEQSCNCCVGKHSLYTGGEIDPTPPQPGQESK